MRRELKICDEYIVGNKWTPAGLGDAEQRLDDKIINWVIGGKIGRELVPVARWGVVSGGTNELGLANVEYMANCLTNVQTGTTISSRIGNSIEGKWIRVKGVLSAAKIIAGANGDPEVLNQLLAVPDPTNGETGMLRYMRTSVKLYLVRDRSMNEYGYVRYTDVFEPPGGSRGPNDPGAGVPFLWNKKMETGSRYEILKEMTIELDADDPQRSFEMSASLGGKSIRYNGAAGYRFQPGIVSNPADGEIRDSAGNLVQGRVAGVNLQGSKEEQSMTNGIYLLGCACVNQETIFAAKGVTSPTLVVNSRMIFEDA